MNQFNEVNNFPEILILGMGRTASSVAVCLAASGSAVTLCCEDLEMHQARIETHLSDLGLHLGITETKKILVTREKTWSETQNLVFITGYSDLAQIQSLIQFLEDFHSRDLIIAVSTDHIELNSLQRHSQRPENIVVVNWSEPAHTTFFMEIVFNAQTDQQIITRLENAARKSWNKDPYTIRAELGVRGRMCTAMLREALYLIDKGYANIEDIDRACRNDAGTYMPFVGNFQYMDLMGTFAYGVVMGKLNQELYNGTAPPPFFNQISGDGRGGEAEKSSFYEYSAEDMEEWDLRMRNFSFEVRSLISKYPFGDTVEID